MHLAETPSALATAPRPPFRSADAKIDSRTRRYVRSDDAW